MYLLKTKNNINSGKVNQFMFYCFCHWKFQIFHTCCIIEKIQSINVVDRIRHHYNHWFGLIGAIYK